MIEKRMNFLRKYDDASRCNIPEIMSYTLISVLKYKYFHKQTGKKILYYFIMIKHLFKAALSHNQ